MRNKVKAAFGPHKPDALDIAVWCIGGLAIAGIWVFDYAGVIARAAGF